MAVAAVVWIGLRLGPIPLRLFVDPRGWWLDVLLGVGSGALLLGVWAGSERTLPLARELEVRLASVLGSLVPSEVLALALISGFAEELFFRGAVLGQWGGQWGWWVATITFALLHSGPGRAFRLWTLFAALAGGLFGALVLWRGSLLAPILGHVLVNAVNLRRLARRRGDSVRLAPDAEER
jgi:membrane protease YdiL (CAAX protease family)